MQAQVVEQERGDVVDAFAQRGQAQREPVQAVEEVFAEALGAHLGLEVLVRGGDDLDVDRTLVAGAHGAHAPVLEDAQQADLRGGGHVGQFVEEEHAAVGADEVAELAFDGAGEGAAPVPEEGGEDEVAGEGAAVDGDEGGLGASRACVQMPGQDVLAGAGFAQDQDRVGALGGHGGQDDALDALAQFARGGRVADQVGSAEHALAAGGGPGLGAVPQFPGVTQGEGVGVDVGRDVARERIGQGRGLEVEHGQQRLGEGVAHGGAGHGVVAGREGSCVARAAGEQACVFDDLHALAEERASHERGADAGGRGAGLEGLGLLL